MKHFPRGLKDALEHELPKAFLDLTLNLRKGRLARFPGTRMVEGVGAEFGTGRVR